MGGRAHNALVAALVVSLVAIVGGAVFIGKYAAENMRLRRELDRQESEVRRLEPALSAADRRALARRGLGDPESTLLADLAQRTELIPHEGVLGGTMRMLPQESRVLTDRWVLAAYEDGHIRGRMLLEYAIADGRVEWKILRAALD